MAGAVSKIVDNPSILAHAYVIGNLYIFRLYRQWINKIWLHKDAVQIRMEGLDWSAGSNQLFFLGSGIPPRGGFIILRLLSRHVSISAELMKAQVHHRSADQTDTDHESPTWNCAKGPHDPGKGMHEAVFDDPAV